MTFASSPMRMLYAMALPRYHHPLVRPASGRALPEPANRHAYHSILGDAILPSEAPQLLCGPSPPTEEDL